MKKMLCILFLLAINLLSNTKPILAENSGVNDFGLKDERGNKDECLLVAINCGNEFPAIEQKIETLQKEISRGRGAYTDNELRILKRQLDNANKTLEFFKQEGGSNLYKYPGE